jgi:glyoxylase-like metal-dependent hydrolase (beta-lactamase superfamily II)
MREKSPGPGPDRRHAAAPVFASDLSSIRALAFALPGARPVSVNAIQVAASVRPRKFVIQGGDETPVMMPRTALQIVYPDGTIMLDAGLDKETHDSFGRADDPYFQDQFDRLRQALNQAQLIVLTHFHADHVTGVVRAPNFDELARKTIVTTTTADLLANKPHRPHLKLSAKAIGQFIVFDYRNCFPVAPGVVLIKSPGHSPDSQMVYFRLQSGQEFLHCVDSAWIMDNILQVKGKAAPWVEEDTDAIMAQLRWIKNLHDTERDLTILVTHDERRWMEVTSAGLVGAELVL